MSAMVAGICDDNSDNQIITETTRVMNELTFESENIGAMGVERNSLVIERHSPAYYVIRLATH
jgi:hypothetical protein